MSSTKKLMFSAMSPLPRRPAFPVLGLSDRFDGLRWLLMWQRREDPWTGDVTEVELAHGHPDDGRFVVVHNLLKQPMRDLGNGARRDPLGLEHVASRAIWTAFERHADCAQLDDERAAEAELIEETGDGGAVLHGWATEPVAVDGIDVAAIVRDLVDSRVVLLDFPTLVVGVVGPIALLSPRIELIDASARLHQYVAGSDRRADSLLT